MQPTIHHRYSPRMKFQTLLQLVVIVSVLLGNCVPAQSAQARTEILPAVNDATMPLNAGNTQPVVRTGWETPGEVKGSSQALTSLACAPNPIITTDGIVYLATRGEIGRSRDFYSSPSPSWEMVQTGLSLPIGTAGGIIEFALDPTCSFHRAWVALGDPVTGSSGSVWRTDNLNDTQPTWTEMLNESQMVSALTVKGASGTNAWVKRIQVSALTPGLVVIAVAMSNHVYVGHSSDDGQTWSWSEDLGQVGTQAIGLELSDHDANKIWVGRPAMARLVRCCFLRTGGSPLVLSI